MPKLRLPATDLLLLAACAIGLVAYYLKIVPSDQADFALGVVAIAGLVPVVISAASALRQRRVTIDLLASIALIFSLLDKQWASGVFINLMLASARLFSAYTQDSVREALKYLVKLRPETALVRRGNKTLKVHVHDVKVGDTVIVELGEMVPVDGVIISGTASLDQSSFTGESLPVTREVGQQVLGSTVVVDGRIEVKAEKVGVDTAFEHITKLVEMTQNNKGRITGIADRFAAVYIVAILLTALGLYLAGFSLSVILSVLLVACADDIAVAIPLSMTAAIAYAARNGVIIKGSNYLEGLAKIKVLLLDKTGTLTQGRLRVASFQMLSDDYPHTEVLQMAAALAALSTHPVSKAIVDYLKALKTEPACLDKAQEISGQGVTASCKRKYVFIGRPSYLHNLGIEITAHQQQEIDKYSEMGYNVTVVSYAKRLVGMFTLRDEIKPEASEAVAELKKLNIKELVMLTGDNEKVAMQVAQRVNIPKFKANLIPDEKLEYLKTKLKQHKYVAMIGDGVNDAPALTLASVGIAMGAIGSDVAIESADIVIMKDNLMQVPKTILLAQKVLMIARQNFIYWGASNVIGLILVFGGVLSPAGAAAYNFVTDFIPILNALRAMRLDVYKQPEKKK